MVNEKGEGKFFCSDDTNGEDVYICTITHTSRMILEEKEFWENLKITFQFIYQSYIPEEIFNDPERVKQIETGLLKNKTTNGLFWQPIM